MRRSNPRVIKAVPYEDGFIAGKKDGTTRSAAGLGMQKKLQVLDGFSGAGEALAQAEVAPSQASAFCVRILKGPGKPLWYAVKETQPLCVGMLVYVPLKNRVEQAIVCEQSKASLIPYKLREVKAPLYAYPVISRARIQLALWMEAYYGAKLELLLQAMLPPSIRSGMKAKTQLFVSLDLNAALPQKFSPKQRMLYEGLRAAGKPVALSECMKGFGVSRSIVSALEKKGCIRLESEQVERVAYADDLGQCLPTQAPKLNPLQQAAVDEISPKMDQFGVFLLHGVTGSGKTEVYFNLMHQCLKKGGGVLFLVPEITLAAELVRRVRSRFDHKGFASVVWHSNLSAGERADAFHSVCTGKCRIVVGARSALFAPIKNLKLIIVDEEHEASYKQEESPRYHGRDTAVYLSKQLDIPCILGSATPSLESLNNAKKGRYSLLKMPRRIDGCELPTVHVIDMRREVKNDVIEPFSRPLIEALYTRLELKQQSILFLNRRGFAPRVLCTECGFSMQCPHCSIHLTYHQQGQQLRCHLCQHVREVPRQCPECKHAPIRWQGLGTQRIYHMLEKRFPRARLGRVDADSLSQKQALRQVMADFRTGKIDILVGTQMLAKGLDFPNVTLVGLIDADLALNIPDFRAAERTFQLIVQVSGRAGRGAHAGEVFIQTFNPHSDPIQHARRGDFDGFFDLELSQRQEFQYPPFRHLIRHLFKGPQQDQVAFYAQKWIDFLIQQRLEDVEIRGPMPAPIEKIKDDYRFQCCYFTQKVSPLMIRLKALEANFDLGREVSSIIDVDPVSFV